MIEDFLYNKVIHYLKEFDECEEKSIDKLVEYFNFIKLEWEAFVYRDDVEENHAEKSSIEAKKILEQINQFTSEEVDMICQAISKHSDKNSQDSAFDEILKDADEMQHWLRNPAEEYFFAKQRTQNIAKEFGLI